jgi:hypothetical protein
MEEQLTFNFEGKTAIWDSNRMCFVDSITDERVDNGGQWRTCLPRMWNKGYRYIHYDSSYTHGTLTFEQFTRDWFAHWYSSFKEHVEDIFKAIEVEKW